MKFTLLFLVVLVVFCPFLSVLADTQGGPDSDVGLDNPLNSDDILAILERVIGFLVLAAIPITAGMIIIGAYQVMFAGGDTEKITTGKRTILYAVIGFVIILLAYSIISIIQNILGVRINT